VTLLFAGIWVRSSLKETPDFVELKSTGKVTRSPLLELIQRYPAHLIIACLIRVGSDVVFYTTSLFVLSYTTSQLGLARQISIQAILIGSALLLLLIPLFASISDKMGRRTVFFVGAVSCAAWMFFFFFELIKSRDPLWISVAVIVAMVLWSIMYAPIGAFIAELFPANVRYSGTSLGIQLTGIFGGGVAPLIETYLLQQSSGTGSVSIYVAATIGISALAMLASLKIPKPND
jgi:MFS family permease